MEASSQKILFPSNSDTIAEVEGNKIFCEDASILKYYFEKI
jgi:hypothetical protein